MNKPILTFIALALVFASCKKDSTATNPTEVPADIKELQVPASFNYETATKINAQISVKNLTDGPLEGIRVNFYNKDPFEGGKLLGSGFTAADGTLNTDVQIPTYLEEVFVECNYKGFANSYTVSTQSNIAVNFGGSPIARKFKKNKSTNVNTRIPAGGNVYYMGTSSASGLPDYLENPGDVLSQDFLDDINSSLPSGQNVPNFNAGYLTTANEYEIVVNALSDVWVTFVTEGAGYKNALGYFVYDTSNPPANASQIDSVFIIFSNTSLAGSGGNLNAGDKVRLGRFPAGKSISWVLFQNAYNSGSNSVNVNAQRIYSRSDFNPETNPNLKQHTVQLVDNARELLLNGFEDILRDNPACDQDFEDMLFYVTANPFTGVETGNSPDITPATDTDNDGVNDAIDEFPTDPLRAFTVNYQGNLGFEDLWPSQGDYDFNDMVLGYDVTHVLNSQNEVKDVNADWTIRAVGAGFNNGFGWEFDNLAPSAVSSITGSSLQEGIVNVSANGTESGQTYATVIAFDDVFNEISHVGGPFINTVKSDPTAAPVTKSVNVTFNSAQDAVDVGLPPYNSFIFVNGDRSKEVHLSNHRPTSLANQSLFGTASDDSDANQSIYYKTANNLPWAIHIYGDYDYPVEYTPINDAHLNFGQWAQSGGTSLENWYLDLAGYRNAGLIY